MANGKKLIIILCLLIGISSYNHIGITMEKKNLIITFRMEHLETQKDLLKEIQILNGHLKFLIKKKRNLI